MGEALDAGMPVVFIKKGLIPEVVCKKGQERAALDTLNRMKIIKWTEYPSVIPKDNGEHDRP